MQRIGFLIAAVFFWFASPVNADTIKGDSIDNAIVINASNAAEGMQLEIAALKENYPDFKIRDARIEQKDDKAYAIWTVVKTSETKKADVYFDITSFYGKN